MIGRGYTRIAHPRLMVAWAGFVIILGALLFACGGLAILARLAGAI
jgi:hypothetical protein